MGFAHLLNAGAPLAAFRRAFSIPDDVELAYCHESDIALHRGADTAFFPLMSVLEGGVRFPIDPLPLNTLRYYGLSADQLPPNFYRVVSCVAKLNQVFGLQLDHHDINHMCSLCGKKKSNYYLKTRDNRLRLISCLLDSNRNSTEEFIWVRGNWFAGDIPPPLSQREVGSSLPLICHISQNCKYIIYSNFDLFSFYCRWFSVHPRSQNSPCPRPRFCVKV